MEASSYNASSTMLILLLQSSQQLNCLPEHAKVAFHRETSDTYYHPIGSMSLTLQVHIMSAFHCAVPPLQQSQEVKWQSNRSHRSLSCEILLGKWRSDQDLSGTNTSVLRRLSNKIGILFRHKRFHFQSFLAILIRRVCFDANNCDHSCKW